MEAFDPSRASLRAPLALLALLSALAYPATAQQFEITPLMLFSVPLTLPMPPPSPPTPVWINGPRSYVLGLGVNDSHQVGFSVGLNSPVGEEPLDNYESYGVYRRTGTTIELLAFSGDPVPDGSGRTFDRVDFVSIEASGDVIVLGRSCEGLPPGSPNCTYGIYRATGGGLSTIVQSGQSLPDSATDTLGPIYEVAAADGQIAFTTRRNPSQRDAVYRWSEGALTRIALEPEPTWAGYGFGWVQVNTSGAVSFIEYFGSSYDDHGVFVYENGVLRTVASTGAPAPGGGTYKVVFMIDMDEGGNVAFETWLRLPNGLCCDSVILADSGGSVRTVVREGQTIPGTQAPFGWPRRPAIHDGRVAFYVWFDDPMGGPRTAATYAEVDGGIARVVYEGQPAPKGLPGKLGVGFPTFMANGDIQFFAFYGYDDGPSSASPFGLFRARFAPEVPALGAPAWVLAAVLLAFSGARAARRASGR